MFNRSGVPDMSNNEQNQVMEMDGEERYDYFLSQVAEDREMDGLDVGVFPGLDKTVWITEPAELKQDLQDVMSEF